MPLVKEGRIVEDSWSVLEDGAEIPDKGDIIVPLERFLTDVDRMNRRVGRIGVALANTADPEVLAPHIGDIDLVSLTFPAFTDGRAYSQARHLRHHLGYAGELRATGNVLADQAGFLTQVGFDTFELTSGQSIEVWNRASGAMTLAYQRGYDGDQKTRDKLQASPNSVSASDCGAAGEHAMPA